jgi:hypothetical protein
VLIEHERVPEGDERPGERGDHDRVVDIGDDAELHVGPHDPDRRLNRLRALGADGHLMPPWRECDGHLRVDHTATVGDHFDALVVDLDDDGNVADRDAREAAPAPDALFAASSSSFRGLVGGDRAAEEYTAQNPHPLGRSVARVWHDGRHVPAASRPALAQVVDPVFEPRGTMPDLAFLGSGRGGGSRRHPDSLSRAPRRSRNDATRLVCRRRPSG